MTPLPTITLRAGARELAFHSASELRDALLLALEEGKEYGQPLVRVGRDDDEPAWLFVGRLLRQRSDWLACAGLALQHAVRSGGPLAQKAFVDLLACDPITVLLLPWTGPLAAELGPLMGTRASTGWGVREGSSAPWLDLVMQEQQRYFALLTDPARTVSPGGPQRRGEVPLPDAAALESLLRKTARTGRFAPTPWGTGPWAFLHQELLFRSWVPEAVTRLLPALWSGTPAERAAALDFLADGQDLWRWRGPLLGMRDARPDWWTVPVSQKPEGWRRSLRPFAPGPTRAETLGDLVSGLGKLAQAQADTPPLADLPPG